MAVFKRFYSNLKLRYKLTLMFSVLVFLSLMMFITVSIVLFEQIIIKNENRAILENLEFFKTSLNNYLSNVEDFSSNINFSADVQDALTLELNALEREDRLEHYNRVYRRLTDDYRNSYGVYAMFLMGKYGNNFRIDIQGGAASLDEWNIDRQRWWERAEALGGLPYWAILEDSRGQKMIGMFRTIRDLNNLYDRSVVGRSAVIISPGIMEGYFSRNRYSEGVYGIIDDTGAVYVSDDNLHDGIFALGDIGGAKGYYNKSLDGSDYIISYSRDNRTGWVFAYAIDSDIPLRDVRFIRQASVIVFVVTLLMIAGLSTLVAGSVTKPLSEMVSLLQEVEKGNLNVCLSSLRGDETGILGRSFNRMVEKIRRGIPLKREKYFRSLLMDTLTPEQYEQARQDMDIAFVNDVYQVVLLRAQREIDEETNRRMEGVISTCEDSRHGIISTTLRSGEYCVISNRNEEDTHTVISRLIERVREGCGVSLMAFSGKSYKSRHFVKHSYEEAMELTRYQFYRTDGLECLDRSFVDSNSWDSAYPEHLENRLLHAVRQEDMEGCRAVLDETLTFFKDKNSGPSVMHAFVFNIYLQLYKNVMKLGLSPDELFGQDLFSRENIQFMSEPVEPAFALLLRVIESFVALAGRGEHGAMNAGVRAALEIIREKYTNPDFGVEYVAQQLDFNENYFSRLFKKEVGIGFVEYVTCLRLERAKELLKNGSVKIKDISIQVGFTNANYFGSWFKENTGLTPSQFRKHYDV